MRRILNALMLMLVMISCQQNRKKPTDILNKYLTTDQSKISYSIAGQGEITLLFVHGWNINKSYWSFQQDRFDDDYQVIAMDLPGFGESVNLSGEYSIASYANDIKVLINQLDLKQVVLIGHSMGGRIILEAAQQNDKVIALIGVDNFKEVGQILTEDLRAEADGFVDWLKSDFASNSSMYVDNYLIHQDTDSLIRSRIVHDYKMANPESAIAAIDSYLSYDHSEVDRLSSLQIPIFLISSSMSPVDTNGLQNTGLKFSVFEMDKTGHFPMVEQPAVFNEFLNKALEEINSDKEKS
ncbi:MAG: alpha/beta hydrolase [Reichenbachiella sp.]|uniref:alpha/beta fold hydrolase n=1 Tax=Reichenbachiella sp. TaxID=2184521 RepID=UPI003297B088